MKPKIIHSLAKNFENFPNSTESGVEFWFARDLQHLLGYSKWDNFSKVLNKAMITCEVSGHDIDDHFAEARKMVDLG